MSASTFAIEPYCDDLGPEKVLHVYEPQSGLRAVVVDNTACGPAIGGVRMAADVSLDEVFRLARAMTLKNTAAGLHPRGWQGGHRCGRAHGRQAAPLPGPSARPPTTSPARTWARTKHARVLGGIPLDEIGATGYGPARCAEVAAHFCDLRLKGATVAIEGFGNVGKHAARFLEELGTTLVAAELARERVRAAMAFRRKS